MNVIEVEKLSKSFNSLKAVDSISFTVKKGEIFGFLGPNGAGKTTTINMLCTLLKPSSGSGRICGYDITFQEREVRKCIGLVFQDITLDDRLTAKENLVLHAMLYGVPKKEREKRIEEVLKMVDLKEKENVIVKKFSGGMKRRLEIARGMIHHPKVLFLDEPTIGLDPQTRSRVWEYILKLKEEYGMTIFLTTHYMEEADEMCDRVAIIDHGKIIAMDKPENLKNNLKGDTIVLDVDDKDMEKALKIFKNGKRFDGQIFLTVKNAGKQIEEILDLCRKNRIKVIEANIRKPTLNDVFLKLTGREIRESSPDLRDQLRARIGWR